MSSVCFEKNLASMEKWYPDFAEAIREKDDWPEDVKVETERSADGETVFCVTKGGKRRYLGGKRNAKAPVRLWRETVGKVHNYAPIVLFGLGSAAYLKSIMSDLPETVNIVVYEPSADIFRAALTEIDLSGELEERAVLFIVDGINGDAFEALIGKVLDVENMEYLIQSIHPNYREMYGDEIKSHVKILHSRTEHILVNFHTGVSLSINIAKNILANLQYLSEGYNTFQLSKAVPYDRAAVLVSAGPSLNKNILELKRAKNNLFIIAVDTAVKPLLKAGIRPDVFTTIDATKPLDLIDTEGADEIPIIAPTYAIHSILEHQKAQKIFYFDGYALPMQMYSTVRKTLRPLSSGGSVACAAFSALYKMGFETVILVGQDLALTGNKTHADGTFEEKMPEIDTTGMEMVKGNCEDKVPTRTDLRIFLEWFESYIKGAKEHGSFRVINATEGGAYIEGTEISTLADALDELCGEEPVDYEARIRNMESAFAPEDRAALDAFLGNIPREFGELLKDAKELERIYRRLQKFGRSGNLSKEKARGLLKRVKKLTKRCYEKTVYQLVEACMPLANFVLRSEYYYEGKDSTEEKEIQDLAKKGIVFSKMLQECAEVLGDYARELYGTDGSAQEDLLLPV